MARVLGKKNAFARALDRYMQFRGWTQARLSDEIGVAEATISRWMNGRNSPSLGVIEEAARKLGMTSWELLRWGDTIKEEEVEPEIESFVTRIIRLPERKRRFVFDMVDQLDPDDVMNVAAAGARA